MIVAEIFPIWAYECPFCNEIHHIQKEHVEYMDTWTEKCPIADEPVRLVNWTFVDNQNFEPLKQGNGQTDDRTSTVDGENNS